MKSPPIALSCSYVPKLLEAEQVQSEILRRTLVVFHVTRHVHCLHKFLSYPHRSLSALVALLVLLSENMILGMIVHAPLWQQSCSTMLPHSFITWYKEKVLSQMCQLLLSILASKAFRSTCLFSISIVLFYMLYVADWAIKSNWDNCSMKAWLL